MSVIVPHPKLSGYTALLLTMTAHLLHRAFPLFGRETPLRVKLFAKAGDFVFGLLHRGVARMDRRVALDDIVLTELRGTENKAAIAARNDSYTCMRPLEYGQFSGFQRFAGIEQT